MISEIFIHIGIHKTASTSIQKTLFNKKNLKLLEDNDYLYPKSWPFNHGLAIFNNFSDNPEKLQINIRKGRSTQDIKKINQVHLESLEEEIKKTKCSKLIISGEIISDMRTNSLIKLKNYFLSTCGNKSKINILAYTRNPVSWSVSSIQEVVKKGFTEESAIEKNQSKVQHLFQNKFEKFIKVFGDKSVKVYSFEEAINHEFGPVGHFLSLLNVNFDTIRKIHFVRENEKISMFAVKFLSFVNFKKPPLKDGKVQDNRKLGDINPILTIGGLKYDISPSLKLKIFQNSLNDLKWLRNHFGINYSFPELSKIQKNNEFLEADVYDLKNAHYNLSPSLQRSLKEFLETYKDKIKGEEWKNIFYN